MLAIRRDDAGRGRRGRRRDLLVRDVHPGASPGTWALALGVGGHLTALRRTAVGGFTLAEAATLDELERARARGGQPAAGRGAADRFFPRRDADADEARVLSHGGPLDPAGIAGPYAVFGPDGGLLAIVSERDGRARAEIVLAPA